MRLLEVIAEDLLELGLSLARPICLVCPRHEPLVEARPSALQESGVGGIPDHQVGEPVLVVLAVDRVGRAHHLPGGEGVQALGDVGADPVVDDRLKRRPCGRPGR